MQKELGKEIQDKAERLKFLKDNCDTSQDFTYMKPFTENELVEMKENLSNVTIKLYDHDQTRKDFMETLKFETKPLKAEQNRIQKGLKQKAELVNEVCYKFIDEETKLVGFYNAEGDLVSTRAAFGNELQTTIFSINKAV